MKGYGNWSFHPYRPLNSLEAAQLPFLCRLAPGAHTLALEWLDNGSTGPHEVCWRKCGNTEFSVMPANAPRLTLQELAPDTDYELLVRRQDGTGESSLRLFRTGKTVGTVVNYLHPLDGVYSFSGRSLCSPSLLKLPGGSLLASMDVFAGGAPQNLTLLFRSDDRGKTWYYVADLLPCFWGKLFWHREKLYMLANTTEYGSLIIGVSEDEGKSWSKPVTILPGSSHTGQGPHKGPMPIIPCNGRLYTAVDYGAWGFGGFGNGLLSIAQDADLMEPENWQCTPFLPFDPAWPGAAAGVSHGALEGNAVVGPDGEIYNFLRYQMNGGTPAWGKALVLRGNKEAPEASLSFAWFAAFNGGSNSKYDLLRDEETGTYWAIVSEVVAEDTPAQRNVLSLAVSEDMQSFRIVKRLLDFRQADPEQVGFQYVSFLIDGADILYLCRTAMNGARNYHDANYSTFHTIPNFRQYLKIQENPGE